MVYKSYPCTGLGMPLGLQEVGATRISRYMNLVKLSALRTGRLILHEVLPGTNFCRRLNQPQGQTAARRRSQLKIPMTPTGIEPVTNTILFTNIYD